MTWVLWQSFCRWASLTTAYEHGCCSSGCRKLPDFCMICCNSRNPTAAHCREKRVVGKGKLYYCWEQGHYILLGGRRRNKCSNIKCRVFLNARNCCCLRKEFTTDAIFNQSSLTLCLILNWELCISRCWLLPIFQRVRTEDGWKKICHWPSNVQCHTQWSDFWIS